MKVLFALLMLTLVTQSQGHVIVRNDFDSPGADGSYRWAFQTDGGIYHEQRGSLQPAASGVPALVVEGQYQYTAPDGQLIHVFYRADENGFQPKLSKQ
ncbi:endocuticle structural glycoprotein SgAbd-1 [Pieris rapae]|uniref:endocuticle structural glycoprotein SgAbd-1 n=1 Tax=Pieris rapae TaxID=64459 RepID=UPI000B92C9DE|nr:endocuticle structural glycoprotein SgAbd-1 [Pieris rapae]